MSALEIERKTMQLKNGFTLSEVLIVLVVLGVIVGYTIPSVISDHQNRDMVAGYQQAMNILNKALHEYYESPSKYYGRTGEGAAEAGSEDAPSVVEQSIQYDDSITYNIGTEEKLDSTYKILHHIIVPYLSTINISGSSDSAVVYKELNGKNVFEYASLAGCSTSSAYVYLQNGMRFCIEYKKNITTTKFGETSYGTIWVDVNGEKGPNSKYIISDLKEKPYGDTFPITMLKNRFVPGTLEDTSASESAETAYFGEKS